MQTLVLSRRDVFSMLSLLGAGACFGATFVLSKLASYDASGHLGPAEVTLFRFTIAALSIPLFFRLSADSLRGNRKWELCLRGVCGFLASFLAAKSVMHRDHELEVGVAAILNSTCVAFAPLFAWAFLSERVTKRAWAAILTMMIGVTVLEWRHLFADPDHTIPMSEVWALASGILAGAVIVLIRDMRSGPDPEKPETIVLYYSLVAIIGSAALCLYGGVAAWRWPSLLGWGVLLLLGTASFAAQWLMSFGLRVQNTVLGAVVLNIQTVVVALLGWLAFDEHYNLTVIIGATIIILVAVSLTLPKRESLVQRTG